MKKIVSMFLAILMGSLMLLALSGCNNDMDAGASIDWGPHHYWDTNEHTVKEKLW